MTFTGRAYDRPCFATPLHASSFEYLVNETDGLNCTQSQVVNRTETKGIRWMFLYKSAVNAWQKLAFNEVKHLAIQKKLDAMSDLEEESDFPWDSDEDSDDDSDDEDE